MVRKQEDFKNRALSLLLKEQGIQCDYEVRRGRKRLDVEAVVDGLTIVLEAETGFHRAAQAIKDADARLRQGIAIIAFAVCYPSDVTEENMAQASLRWTLRTVAGSPNAQWSSGGVAELAGAVLQSPAAVDDADAAARILSRGLDEVVPRS